MAFHFKRGVYNRFRREAKGNDYFSYLRKKTSNRSQKIKNKGCLVTLITWSLAIAIIPFVFVVAYIKVLITNLIKKNSMKMN